MVMKTILLAFMACSMAVNMIEGKKLLTCEDYIAGQPMQICLNGNIFERRDEEGIDHSAAELDCQSRGGHLASISTDDEVVALAELVPTGEAAWLGAYQDNGNELNYDFTAVVAGVAAITTADAMAVVIESDDATIGNLDEDAITSTDVDHYFCKYKYFHNRKIFFGFPEAGASQTTAATTCSGLLAPQMDGRLIQIDSLKLDNYIAGEIENLVDLTPPEEYVWWINMRYGEATMKYNWGVQGSYSPYRKWCSGQPDPDLGTPIAAADRCVVLTPAGCWAVANCNNAMIGDSAIFTMCEFDIRGSEPTKNDLFTLIQVLRQNVHEINKDCKRCKGVSHISSPME